MIEPEIIRSKRKTITLTVDNSCRVTVKAPLKMPLSEIKKFVAEKNKWLNEKLAFYQSVNDRNRDVLDYEEAMFFGERYTITFGAVKAVAIEGETMFFPARLKGDKTKFLNALKRFYKETANEYTASRVAAQAIAMKIPYKSLKITDSKKRWGACDSEGNLSFNFRVIMLPPYVIDYIIVHELSHIKHLNHSPAFWSAVEKYFPAYKDCRKKLKENNYIMNLLRK